MAIGEGMSFCCNQSDIACCIWYIGWEFHPRWSNSNVYTASKKLPFFLCLRHPTMSAKALCFQAVLSVSFVRSSGQISFPLYLMNGLNNLDETFTEYSIARIDDLLIFWRSEDKGQGDSRPSRWRRHPRWRWALKSIFKLILCHQRLWLVSDLRC